jgi:hypothetical protein
MSAVESWRDRTFVVADPDCRIRVPGALSEFVRWQAGEALPAGAVPGGFKLIPNGTEVRATAVEIVQTGSQASVVFAEVEGAVDGRTWGWTSTRNLKGQFRSVTLGAVAPEPGAGRFSATAAWRGGEYLGQVTLVRVLDVTLNVEFMTEALTGPFLDMFNAAAEDGVQVAINSGFRSYPDQKYLWEGYKAGRPGFNLAAEPGKSNHQNGIAIDIDTAGGVGSRIYDWLAANATAFGFIRTVKSEAWHWEYRPEAAARARAQGRHQL